MGGCELDLTDAEMKNSPAVIEVFAMWGGIEIFVPDSWEIVAEVVPKSTCCGTKKLSPCNWTELPPPAGPDEGVTDVISGGGPQSLRSISIFCGCGKKILAVATSTR